MRLQLYPLHCTLRWLIVDCFFGTNIGLSSNELLNEEGLDASVCELLDEMSLEEKRIECTNRHIRQSTVPSIGAESGMKTIHMMKIHFLTERAFIRNDKRWKSDQIIAVDLFP